MTWLHAQFLALLVFLDAHPAFYPFVVWPILTGGISLAETKLAPRVPRLVSFAKSQGWDLGRAVSWLWAKLRAVDPKVPPLPPGAGAAVALLFLGAALAVPHLALADVLPDPHPGPVPSPTLGAVFGGLLAAVAIAAVAGWFMVRAARRERQAYADGTWSRRTTRAFAAQRERRRRFLGALGAVPILALPGCAAFWSAMPTVISVIETAGTVLDQIAGFVDDYFRTHNADPDLQRKVDLAIAKTRGALLVLESASKGVTDIHDKNLAAALQAFREAYDALLELVGPIGVIRAEPGQKLGAIAGELKVPPSSAFTAGDE